MTTKVRSGYVLCRGVMDDTTGEVYERLEDLVGAWKGTLSLRKQRDDGTIVELSDEEYRRADELAKTHPPVGSRWKQDVLTYTWVVEKRGTKWITLREYRPDGQTQQVALEDWPGKWTRA